MIYAGLVAGGSGTRMGAQLPKQFLSLKGKPILIRTAERFLEVPEIDTVVIGLPEDYLAYTQELLEQYQIDTSRVVLTAGGSNRNETILKMIDYLKEKLGAGPEDFLMTHDAVRPFVSVRVLREHIAARGSYPVIGTVVPATDTIVISESGTLMDTIPNRSTMYQAQTPQSFLIGDWEECLAAIPKSCQGAFTDACGVFLSQGKKAYMVRGEKQNIKLTEPVDLLMAEALLAHEQV